MKRVMVAGLYHETHTFLSGKTSLSDFTIVRGEELLAEPDGNSPIGMAIDTARRLGWEIVPAVDIRAMPGPIVADEVVDLFWDSFKSEAESAPMCRVDGIFLVLHGAMVSESLDDVEGEILERIRGFTNGSGIPICGVMDLHANFTAKMCMNSDGLIAYRENPHTDARAVAKDAVLLLDRLMRTGERPVTVWEHPAIMWPPTGTGTDDEPMFSLENMAREIERENSDVLAVNVLGGYAFADIPETGLSFTVVTLGSLISARTLLSRMSGYAVQHRELGCPIDLSIDEAIAELTLYDQGPIVFAEPSDNIGAGAPGDGVGLLRALIENDVKNAAIAINDPAAVMAARNLCMGETAHISIGGRSCALGLGSLTLEVELISIGDGKFPLEDSNSHLASMVGSHIDMGLCAVVRHKGVTILLTSRKTPPFDLGQFRSIGIEPEKLFVIGVKAAVAHGRAYDPIAVASYTVDTPGPCTSNLLSLPYSKVCRPIFPLDQFAIQESCVTISDAPRQAVTLPSV